MRRDLKKRLRENGTLTVSDKQLNEEFEKRKEELLENNSEKEAKTLLLEDLYDDAYDAYVAQAAADADVTYKVNVTYDMFVNYQQP